MLQHACTPWLKELHNMYGIAVQTKQKKKMLNIYGIPNCITKLADFDAAIYKWFQTQRNYCPGFLCQCLVACMPSVLFLLFLSLLLFYFWEEGRREELFSYKNKNIYKILKSAQLSGPELFEFCVFHCI